jgi:hypothetical protein
MYLHSHEPSLEELLDDPNHAPANGSGRVASRGRLGSGRGCSTKVRRSRRATLVGLVVSEANASVLFRPHQVWTKTSVTPDGADLRVSVARGD